MAKSAIIGAMHVTLGANTAAFEKAMTHAQSRLSRFSSGMGKAAAGVAAAMAGVGAAVAVAVRGTLREADKLTKLSRSIGVPVEQLSALKHAAELSGASIDELGRLFRNVARNMQGAAQAPSEFSRALESIGVAWRDQEGNFIRADQLMLAVADKFKGMEDGAGKTALAMKIFGEEMGPKFVSMLNQGSAGIAAMMEEAIQLGLVIDQETGAAAERFNDALDKMGKAQTGIITQITARLAPTFAMLAERMVEATKNSNALKYAGDLLAGTLKALLTAGTAVAAIFREMGRTVAAVAGAVLSVAQGEFFQALNLVQQHWSNAKEAVAADMQFINDLWAETAAKTAETTQQFQEQTAAPVVQSTRAMAAAAREHNMAMREGQMVMESLQGPYEQMMATQDRLRELHEQGTLSARTFGLAMQRATMVAASAYAGLAVQIGGALQSVFGKSKAVAIAVAIANVAESITKTLATYGATPWGWAAAAAAAASGAAQLATIKSTNLGGGGKTPSVRGGGGESAQQQAAAPQQTVSVQGISPGQLFTGDAMRELVEDLLQRQRDGAHVVLS